LSGCEDARQLRAGEDFLTKSGLSPEGQCGRAAGDRGPRDVEKRQTVARTATVAPSPPEVATASECVEAFGAEYDYVCRVLRRFHVRDADVEDVAQEVFLVVWRRWREYDPARPLRPWLAGISFRVAYNQRSRAGREVPEPWLDETADPDADPEKGLAQADMRDVIRRALDGISEKPRSVLVLHDVDEISMRDIAALLAVPLHTAYSRLRVGRRQLLASLRRLQATAHEGKAFDLPGQLDELLARERRPFELDPARKRAAMARLRALVPLLPALPQAPAVGRLRPRVPLVAAAKLGALLGLGGALWFGLAAARRPAPQAPGAQLVVVSAAAPRPDDVRGPPRPPLAAEAAARAALASATTAAVQNRSGLAAASTLPAETGARSEGLVGYWRLDDGVSSAYARDLSGAGNDCTLHHLDRSLAWTEGHHGGALQFGGAGWLECPQRAALDQANDEITVALWVKRGSRTDRVRALVTRQLGHDTRDAFHLGFRDDTLILQSSLWRVTVAASFAAAHADSGGHDPGGHADNDGWHHIAATRGADRRAKLYVDGILVASKKTGPLLAGADRGALIIGGGINGANPDHVTERFDGAIDEVLLFARALGPGEIAALASGSQPRVSQ
jgi:RNA polymerase sigma-70 factor (ECF subfamily)